MIASLEYIRELVASSRYEEALDALEALLRVDPDPLNWTVLGPSRVLDSSLWRESLNIAATLLPKLSGGRADHQLSRLHGLLGYISLRLGGIHVAESHLRAAIHILTWDLSDIPGAVRQQRRLSIVLKNLGLFHQARFECERAISLADAHGLERESLANRQNLAVLLIKMGRLRDVPGILDEIDARLGSAMDPRSRLRFNLVRANYLRISGKYDDALDLLRDVAQVTREGGYSREEAIALEYSADCYMGRGEYDKARSCYEDTMRIAETIAPEGDLVPEVCHRLGEAIVHLGEANKAILLCERGLRSARALGDRYEECATHRPYAMALKAAGNSRKALRIADEGIELARNYEIPFELARLLAWSGETRMPDPLEQMLARRQLWEARAAFERMGLIYAVASIDRLLGFDEASEPLHGTATISSISSKLDMGALKFGIITASPHLSEAVQTIQSVASSIIPVLISGESGVGKELLAQAIHKMSDRHKGPFVAINCGAISLSLHDSEFFGHERGAFTGAVASREGLLFSANRGTLFLDEIGELPLPVQSALLRVLETGELRTVGRDDIRITDIRIVAATNAPLEALVERGSFRQDLFYRLNGVRVTIPPLREREEDIRLLFRYFWSKSTASARKTLLLGDEVESLLCAYDWPGNVRELRHEVARVVALAPDRSTIGQDAFLPQLRRKDSRSLRKAREKRDERAEEREQIINALRAHGGNKAEAARSLGGMKRTTLIYRMERLGIRPEEYLEQGLR